MRRKVLIFAALSAVAGCSRTRQIEPPNAIVVESPTATKAEWPGPVGQTVTLDGLAINMKAGAFLRCPHQGGIWIENLHSWPDGFYMGEDRCKRLRVTGTVLRRADMPVFVLTPGTMGIQGIPVKTQEEVEECKWRYLLKDATWTVIE